MKLLNLNLISTRNDKVFTVNISAAVSTMASDDGCTNAVYDDK